MARILTGIQSSGKPHLGNVLGAILPAIELSEKKENDSYFFIADMHSLTTIKDGKTRKNNVYEVAAAWLAGKEGRAARKHADDHRLGEGPVEDQRTA
ncbi:MAG: hypothetical protein ACPF9D_02580, partial [Owenweeksia sp.]